MAESREHVALRVDRRLIETIRALRIDDAIVAAVANEHRRLDLVRPALERVIAQLPSRIGEIARADDPPDSILNRRIVVEQIGTEIERSGGHGDRLDARLTARRAGGAPSAHAHPGDADPRRV